MTGKAYPSDVSDEEWALVAPYLALLPKGAGQRRHGLHQVFNGLSYVVKTACRRASPLAGQRCTTIPRDYTLNDRRWRWPSM
jgi:transposase